MFTRTYFPGGYFAPTYWPEAGATPVPPIPPVVVTTSTFAGFGGGFLGPYYKQKRKEYEYVAPPPVFRYDHGALKRVLSDALAFADTAELPVTRRALDRAASMYMRKMTPGFRALLEDPEIAREKQRKRLKRLKDDDELLLMLL